MTSWRRPTSLSTREGGAWRGEPRPFEAAHWLEIDDRRDDGLALKARLLTQVPEVVVATRPTSHAPGEELYGEALAWRDTFAAGTAAPRHEGTIPS